MKFETNPMTLFRPIFLFSSLHKLWICLKVCYFFCHRKDYQALKSLHNFSSLLSKIQYYETWQFGHPFAIRVTPYNWLDYLLTAFLLLLLPNFQSSCSVCSWERSIKTFLTNFHLEHLLVSLKKYTDLPSWYAPLGPQVISLQKELRPM